MNLKIQNISLSFEKQLIFKDINAELKIGDLLIVKGRNGSGKTSLLKIIAGILELQDQDDFENEENFFTKNDQKYGFTKEINLSGEILCENLSISKNKEVYFYTRSYISADFELYEDFSIEYYLKFWQKTNELCVIPVNSVINYFSFQKMIDEKKTINEISSGWKKRVQYSRLMFENRVIWILDEPFNFLDEGGKDLIMNMINSKILSLGIVILSDNQGEIEKHLANQKNDNIKYINLS